MRSDVAVYCIKCIVNNKKYIGSTNNIKIRFSRHRRDLNKGCHSNIHLQNSWNKYGENNFIFYILKECSMQSLLDYEGKYIELLKTYDRKFGFNLIRSPARPIVSNETKKRMAISSMGVKHTEETKRKIAKWNTGRITSQDTRDKIGKSNKGKKRTKEQVEKMSIVHSGKNNGMYGKKHTKKSRVKISKALIGKVCGENHPSAKLTEKNVILIKQLLNGGTGCTELANIFGVTKGCISAIKKGRTWKKVKIN